MAGVLAGCASLLCVSLAAAAQRGSAVDAVFVALVYQPRADRGPIEQKRLESRLAAARRSGAAYVVLPAAPGELSRSHLFAAPYSAARLARLARRHQVGVAASVAEPVGRTAGYRLMSVLIDRDGRVLLRHPQVMPPPGGSARFVRGASVPLESVDDGERRLAVLAAADLQAGVPRLAARGAGTILVSSGGVSTDAPSWRRFCRELALAHRVNLVVASPSPAHAGVFTRDGSDSGAAPHPEHVVSAVLTDPPRAPGALGLPSIPLPTTYEAVSALVALGRDLFFEPRLSRDGRVSCATCHRPDQAFANGERTGAGVDGRRSTRNVPSLLNVAYRSVLQWDGGSVSLEEQAKFPMSHAFEMDLPYLDSVSSLRQDPAYAQRFRETTGREIDFEQVSRALAAYQRTLVSADSAFDRFQYGGERAALTAAARRGLALYTGKAGCEHCHQIGEGFALFTDDRFHNTGVGYRGGFDDLGRGGITDARSSGSFLTPSLRNVALTAPYMHDGSLATLDEVVAFYDRGGTANPYRDRTLRRLRLTAGERRDLVAFLGALTGSASFTVDGRPCDPAPPTRARVAALEFEARPGEVGRNRQALARLVGEAARRGASLIALPEHAQTGPLSGAGGVGAGWQRAADLSADDAHRVFGALARRNRVWLTVPVVDRDPRTARHTVSTLLLDDSGRVVARSTKQSPRRELGDGAASGGPDHDLKSVDTPFGRVGLLSGDELADGVPRLAERGARVLLVGASWSASDGRDWEKLARRLARDFEVTLVIATLAGVGQQPEYGAAVVGPDGTVLARPEAPARFAHALLPDGTLASSAPALGLPTVPVPSHRPPSSASVDLGRRLFSDPRLSRDGRVSCATCHDPDRAFADGVRVARGVYGRTGTRNTPTLLNSAYRPLLAWDGTATSLEEQVRRALRGWAEMDADEDAVAAFVEHDAAYAPAIRALNGGKFTGARDVTRALADYVRTLVSGGSLYDRYSYGGERSALSPAARRGLRLFRGKAGCAECHTLGRRDALLTDLERHNTGVGYQPRFEYLGYGGDGFEVSAARRNDFKGQYVTPSLRDVARTAPYMHDGSLASLREVVSFYNRGGVPNPFLDPRIRPLGLIAHEEADLVAFLEALDGRPNDSKTVQDMSSSAATAAHQP